MSGRQDYTDQSVDESSTSDHKDYNEQRNNPEKKNDNLDVSNYNSNVLKESLLLDDSRSSSAKPELPNTSDELMPPKEDDEYDLHRHRIINKGNENSFSNASLVANYGDSDLYPLGSSRININTPFPNVPGANTNGPMFDPFGTRNSSSSNIGGGMIFDPFKNKPKDNKEKPGYSGYPGAKYDYPFGNLGNNNNNNNGGGFV